MPELLDFAVPMRVKPNKPLVDVLFTYITSVEVLAPVQTRRASPPNPSVNLQQRVTLYSVLGSSPVTETELPTFAADQLPEFVKVTADIVPVLKPPRRHLL